MGRDLFFLDWFQLQRLKELQKNDKNFDGDGFREKNVDIGSFSMGSGDAWPVYLRFFLIAGYRKVSAEEERRLPAPKEFLLETILSVIPPNHRMIPYNVETQSLASKNNVGEEELWRRRTKFIDEDALALEENQIILTACGLGAIVELMRHHRTEQFAPGYKKYWNSYLIQQASRCFASLKEFLEPSVDGDPFDRSLSCNDLNKKDCLELIAQFEHASLFPFSIGIVE